MQSDGEWYGGKEGCSGQLWREEKERGKRRKERKER